MPYMAYGQTEALQEDRLQNEPRLSLPQLLRPARQRAVLRRLEGVCNQRIGLAEA